MRLINTKTTGFESKTEKVLHCVEPHNAKQQQNTQCDLFIRQHRDVSQLEESSLPQ